MNASTMLSMNGQSSVISKSSVRRFGKLRAGSSCPEPSQRVEGLPQSFKPTSQDHLCREISHGHTRINRRALCLFGDGFLLGQIEDFGGARSRNEADAGIVGEHDIARDDSNAGNLNLTVDLDRFDAPFTGDR